MTTHLLSLLILLAGCTPERHDIPSPGQQASQEIDSPMKLVASMTKYDVGILWKGPNWTEDTPAVIGSRIQEQSDSWRKAIADGKLAGAVRVASTEDLWGLLFFKTESMDEMKAIAGDAPSVKEGLLKGEVVTVWGTRGLGTGLAEALKENPETEMKRETYYMAIYKKGENWSEKADDQSTREATSEGIKYLYDLYKAGTLRFYAALEDFSRPTRGAAILNASSEMEAKEIAMKSPMVMNNRLTVTVTPVYVIGGVLP